jgi:hypothetical protein
VGYELLAPDEPRPLLTLDYPTVKFNFLGYSFQPRQAKSRHGNLFLNFSPAVSTKAAKSIGSTIRSWKIHPWTQLSIEKIAESFNSAFAAGSTTTATTIGRCSRLFWDSSTMRWSDGRAENTNA